VGVVGRLMPLPTDATGQGVSTAPPPPVADESAPRNDGFGNPHAKTLEAEPEPRRFLGRHGGPLGALRGATQLTVAHGRPWSSKAGPRRVRTTALKLRRARGGALPSRGSEP
jgi:hypothetical protein